METQHLGNLSVETVVQADEHATQVAVLNADELSATTTSSDDVTSMPVPSEVNALALSVESIVRSVRARLGEGFDDAVIAAEVEAELALYATARVTQFVPILVESRVRVRICHSGRPGANGDGGRGDQ